MKTLLTLCLTIAVLLGSVGVSWSADYQKGLTAAKSGDFATALREWTPLAEQGNADAQSSLGVMYEKGLGVSQDIKTAMKWYRLAAKQGNANAQFNLGTMYENGLGVSQDYKTAMKWYRLAAKQGNANAQYNLGVMYNVGKGVSQDYKTAVKWFRLSAKQGHAFAQYNLGNMYAKGQGVSQDYVRAHMWFNIAASSGNKVVVKVAIKNRDIAAKKMTSSQLAKSQDLARNFVPTKSSPVVTAIKSPPPSPSAAETEVQKLRKENARLKKNQQSKPKQVAKIPPPKKSSKPYVLQFKKVPKRPDDIAVIIANSNYTKQGKDIPNVDPAYNDGENIKKYFMQAKGVREGNIIYLKDATGAQLTEVFGNKENHKANLFNWVKPNKSNVYVYYVGHGAPASNDGSAFLVPVDAKSQTIEFSGYPLNNLYRNLGKIKARSITVILEACFSGVSQAGMLLPRSSGITIVAKASKVPANVKVISAGSADQMASWEKDESQSLFTKYFLRAMSGDGDKNKDGKVDDAELQNYLEGTMTYFARRYYGRDQKVQIVSGR